LDKGEDSGVDSVCRLAWALFWAVTG